MLAPYVPETQQESKIRQLAEILTATLFPPGILVLQGQKISMSGRYSYSTQTATNIAFTFFEHGTKVLLIAKWGQAGVAGDRVRIEGIYEQIAKAANADRKTDTPVEVAPIELVWDEVLKKFPDLKLHADDGNHSSELGGLVTAIAFDCWLFDEPPPEESLPRKNHKYLQEVSQIATEICRRQKSKNTKVAKSLNHRTPDKATHRKTKATRTVCERGIVNSANTREPWNEIVI